MIKLNKLLLLLILILFLSTGCSSSEERNILSDKLVRLEINECKEINIVADEKYNKTGIIMEEGEMYNIEILTNNNWKDGDIIVKPEKGWLREEEDLGLKRPFVWMMEPFRRVKGESWFALCGGIIGNDIEEFGLKNPYEAKATGELYIFANDLGFKYGNNSGSLKIKITRVDREE